MEPLATYNPQDIEVIVAGNVISGFAEDKVTVERESDQVDDDVGADGEVVRRLTNDKRGTITITLLQTSKSNLFLSTLAKTDEFTGAGSFPTIIKDTRGRDLHIAAQSWIRKMATAGYGARVETRVWVIRTDNLQSLVAGAA